LRARRRAHFASDPRWFCEQYRALAERSAAHNLRAARAPPPHAVALLMKFSEFRANQVLEAGPYLVTESEILAFARAYDRQWFHTDTQAAAKGRFAGLIASGWHTCAIAMRLITDTALQGSESFASPGVAYVKWPQPVRPGDHLWLRATVIETRCARSQPTLGILRWRWRLFNAGDEEVLDLEATSLFDLSQSCAP